MGLFTEDVKTKIRPEVLYGAQTLQNLAGQTPAIPQQGVAELTPMQMLIQSQLPALFGNINQGGQQAMDYYGDVLSGDYDPRTSPYYEGLRQESERLQGQGVTSLRQRAEMGGMLQSSNAAAQEGQFINQSNAALLRELGGLYETERGRQGQAAEGIQRAGGQQVQNIAAVGGVADQQRIIEQAQQDALYQQLIMQILFPYQYQAQLAQALMGMPGGVQVTGGGLTDLSQGLILGGTVAGAVMNPAGGAAAMTQTPQTAPSMGAAGNPYSSMGQYQMGGYGGGF